MIETIIPSIFFTVFVFVMISIAAYRYDRNTWRTFSVILGTILCAWFSTVVFVGKTGFFVTNPFFAPMMIFAFLTLFHFLRKVYHSHLVREIMMHVPLYTMVGIQTFRVMGVAFLNMYEAHLLPGIFALSAGWGDIIVGVSAPFVALALFFNMPHSKKIAIVWNIVGIADLVIALATGILSFSRPVQLLPILPVEISTEPIALYPLVIIPLFVVPLSLLLHLFTQVALRRAERAIL